MDSEELQQREGGTFAICKEGGQDRAEPSQEPENLLRTHPCIPDNGIATESFPETIQMEGTNNLYSSKDDIQKDIVELSACANLTSIEESVKSPPRSITSWNKTNRADVEHSLEERAGEAFNISVTVNDFGVEGSLGNRSAERVPEVEHSTTPTQDGQAEAELAGSSSSEKGRGDSISPAYAETLPTLN